MPPWVSPQLDCGLGNRLFQFAAACGTAERWGLRTVFYMPECAGAHHGAVGSLFRLFPSVEVVEEQEQATAIPEPERRYYEYIDPEDEAPIGGNIIFRGFRQSPRYFPKQPGKLRPSWANALGGGPIMRALEKELGLSDPEERRRTVALHFRLGDYKNLPHYNYPAEKYYPVALDRVRPWQRVILFSDEPHLCLKMFASWASIHGIQLTVAKVRADIESLYQMSLCLGGTITSNSTFSWWAAWFAHEAGAPWATYPSSMGVGQPKPVDYYPEWATVIPVDSNPSEN